MILKKIEIFGFKSFGKRTVIEFTEKVTGIVGPNGSGKSNITEAIRWVMGEQRVKPLRSEKMEDVIFSGSDEKKALGYAQVILTLDNADNIFHAPYDEIEVSRKLYRSGESEYYLNKNQCRLKDIQGIFMDTGLGREGYSIIGQGQIESIVTNSPAGIKLLIDEAAGIVRYRVRKQEAQRKLERAKNNIYRITDIIKELEDRLPSLKRQSEKARVFVELKERLKKAEIGVFAQRMDYLGEKAVKYGVNIDTLNESLEQLQNELSELDEQYRLTKISLSGIQGDLSRSAERIKTLSSEYENARIASSVAASRLQSLEENISELSTDDDNYARNIKLLKSERAKLIESYRQKKEQAAALKETLTQYREKVNRCAASLQENQSKLRALKGYEQSMQSYNYAIRELMRLKSTDSYLAENLHTTVGEVVNTSDEYAAAVTEALGASASNLITTDEKAAARCIELLKRNSWGRATFLPIKIIKAQTNGDIKSALKNAEGYLGCADELVETQEIYRPIVSSILSRTAVFRDLNCANSAAAASGHRFKMVTLGGEILYAGGAITGGRHKNNDNGSIMRRNEINRLEQEVNREKDTYDKLLNSQENSAEDEIASLREEMAAEYERIKNSEERAKYFEEQLNYRRNKAERLEGEKQEILKTIENGKHLDARYKEESASAEEQFRKLTEQKEKLSENFAEVNEAIISKSREKGELSARIASIAADKTAVDMEIAHLQADMMDDYGITYAEAKTAPLEEEAEYTDAPEEIARLKERIKRLGNINVDSLEEYRLLRERYENMSAQRDDLAQSREELTKVIDEITRGMEKQFIREFDSIKAEFNKVFRELFGGGEASLELSDPMDVMNSGVDILARPPHTKMRNIGSLSGGEKSMTAIALLFAILDLKPSPFCVLDEIDAALDDANIVRFREYMRRFTADNQFILITHKKLTMEIAEGLYGVSKGADGISRVVSIKLNETEKYGE